MASRPLHFFWLIDGSGSMRAGGKIDAVNRAIRESIPYLRATARDNPQATLFVNAIRFGDDARWIGDKLKTVAEYRWQDIEAGGATALGEALTLVGEALQPPLMTDRGLTPVIVLVTDGLPTDDYQAGLDHLLSKPWGRQSLRLVFALGEDAATDDARKIFQAFMGAGPLAPLQITNPDMLIEQVRWLATSTVQAAVSPAATQEDNASEWAAALPLLTGEETAEMEEAAVW